MTEIVKRVCWVCGQAMNVQKGGKGRPKEAHDACREYVTRKAQADAALMRITFQPDMARIVRGAIMAVRNELVKEGDSSHPDGDNDTVRERMAVFQHPAIR